MSVQSKKIKFSWDGNKPRMSPKPNDDGINSRGLTDVLCHTNDSATFQMRVEVLLRDGP